jgi:hypothetical protein
MLHAKGLEAADAAHGDDPDHDRSVRLGCRSDPDLAEQAIPELQPLVNGVAAEHAPSLDGELRVAREVDTDASSPSRPREGVRRAGTARSRDHDDTSDLRVQRPLE